jgi:DNA-binding NarL/FixJ family response regulator
MGISGFLSKEQPIEDVVEMIYKVTDEGSALSETVLKSMLNKMNQTKPEIRPLGEDFGLTPRELTILQELSYGKNHQAIGEFLHISDNTVRTHLEHILSKMDAHSRLEAVSLAIQSKIISAPRSAL